MVGGTTMEWVLMWVWPLLIVVGLGLTGYVAVRIIRHGLAGTSAAGNDARRILDERFARGDIDEPEYRRRRAGLR